MYKRSLAWQDKGESVRELANAHEFVAGAAVVYRRSAIESTGWPDGSLLDCRRGAVLAGGEDAELCLEIRRAGWSVWYTPEARCEHEGHRHGDESEQARVEDAVHPQTIRDRGQP